MPILVFLAFVSLGLPDGVIGLAWPSLRGRVRVGASRSRHPAGRGRARVFRVGDWSPGGVMIRFGLGATLGRERAFA